MIWITNAIRATVAPTVLLLGVATAPARTAVHSASGYLLCPVGQRLHGAVKLDNRAAIEFRLSSQLRYTSPSYFGGYTYDYGVRGGSWRADTVGNIATVNVFCTGATQ